jgi:hypothetical protein
MKNFEEEQTIILTVSGESHASQKGASEVYKKAPDLKIGGFLDLLRVCLSSIERLDFKAWQNVIQASPAISSPAS